MPALPDTQLVTVTRIIGDIPEIQPVIIDTDSDEELWTNSMIGIYFTCGWSQDKMGALCYPRREALFDWKWKDVSTLDPKSLRQYVKLSGHSNEILLNLDICGDDIAVKIDPLSSSWTSYQTVKAHLSINMNNKTQQLISKLEDTLTDMGLFDDNCDHKGTILYLNDGKLELELKLLSDGTDLTIYDYECDLYKYNQKVTKVAFDENTFFNIDAQYQLGVKVVIKIEDDIYGNIGETRLIITRLKIDSQT